MHKKHRIFKMFAIGATIKIKETDYVNEKYPNFIGRTAIITATPVHPSNFYKLSLKTTDAEDLKSSSSIELESSAMEFVEISGASSHTESKTALTSENNARPRASSFGQILHCSQAHALKKGVSVTILRTENVVQRCPHLVGQEGVVKEAPGKL